MATQTVLIVEDDPMTAALLEMIVQEAGHLAVVASDGITAMELLQQHLPDTVLLDLNLPQLNGYSFASLVNEFSEHRPRILVVTSSPEDYQQHLQGLADGCLPKPINRQQLLSLLT